MLNNASGLIPDEDCIKKLRGTIRNISKILINKIIA
jgi:hypothetical protein